MFTKKQGEILLSVLLYVSLHPTMVIRGVPPMYRGNQVQVLSSTRYCHLHYEKSKKATERFGKADFLGRARKPAMSLKR